MEEFVEGTIGEEWFKERYEEQTERKRESTRGQDKMIDTSEAYISEGERTAN